MHGSVLVNGRGGPDTRSVDAVIDTSSIVHYLDPFTSNPGGLKQSLRGLGLMDIPFSTLPGADKRTHKGNAKLDPNRKFLRMTSIIPSTQFQLTYQHWPLTNGLMAKGLVARGLPGFYSPPVEPLGIEPPDMENVNARIPNAYWYFTKAKIDIKPPAYVPDSLATRNYDTLVAKDIEEPRIIIPRFERPDFDLRGVSEATLKRFPNRLFDTIPGGIQFVNRNKAQPTGESAAPRRRFRAASIWDVFEAPNDPRPGDDPELIREIRRESYYRANFDFRDPDEGIDPKDPKPSYSIRKAYQPNYGRLYRPGGN